MFKIESWRALFDKDFDKVFNELFIRFLGFVCLGLWIIWADPFGLSSASDKALASDISRFRAYAAPVAPAPITVVNIDYASIQLMHESDKALLTADDWPLDYKDHARILSTVVSRAREDGAPAAVFYDIFFERPRASSGDMAALDRTLANINKSQNGPRPYPPIYLAGGGVRMPMSALSYASLGQPALVASAWEGRGDYYPLSAMLHEPGDDAYTSIPASAPSAALTLYRALCRARGDACDWLRDDDQALALQWMLREGAACSRRTPGLSAYVAMTAWRYLGFGETPKAADPDCLPFHQVALRDLFATTPQSLRPPHLGVDEPYVLLIGVVMPSLNDYHDTPLYEKLAGVYIHAMATENLNRLGKDYLRKQNIRLISAGVWLLIALMIYYWYEPLRRWGARHTPSGISTLKRRIRAWLRRRWRLQRHNQRSLHIQSFPLRILRPLWRPILLIILWTTIVLCIYLICYAVLDIALEGWLFMTGLVSLVLFRRHKPTDQSNPPARRPDVE